MSKHAGDSFQHHKPERRFRMVRSHFTQSVQVFPSALGWMALVWADGRVRGLSFGHATPQAARDDVCRVSLDALAPDAVVVDEPEVTSLATRLQAYAEGADDDFLNVSVDLGPQTEFQRRVVEHCRRIPLGKTLTYGELAEKAGYPRAARAVGNCMRTNRVPLIVPCHRVIGSGGSMRGYSAGEGIRMKLRLLELESCDSIRENPGPWQRPRILVNSAGFRTSQDGSRCVSLGVI